MDSLLDAREKERRAWRESRGLRSTHQNLWGQVSEIYDMDHEGKFWDKVSGNQLNSDEVVVA